MRIRVLFIFTQINPYQHRGKENCLKIHQWKRSGKKINLVPEAGDILEREEIVLESEKRLKTSCVYNAMNAKNYFIAFHKVAPAGVILHKGHPG